MRKLSKLGFFAIALTFFFGALTVTDSNAQANVLNTILDRMEEHKNALQSLEANVRMTTYNSQLKINTDDRTGTTYYLTQKGKKPYVRVDWSNPKEVLMVKNGKYFLYMEKLNQYYFGKVSDANKNTKTSSALDFMNMSKSELKNNYKPQKLDNVIMNGEEIWHLKLTPLTKKSYQYAEIWVDKNGMPLQAKIVEKNNDTNTIRLSNIKKNLVIDAAVFNWEPPKSAEMIKG